MLLTHDHVDHTDLRTVSPLAEASSDASVVVSFTARDTLAEAGLETGRLVVPEVGKALSAAGATIAAIPSAHTELERDPERGYPYLGYVVQWGGVTIYDAGDTVLYDGLIKTLSGWRIDGAFVPINGRDYFRTKNGIVGNTDLREAAKLAETLDVGVIVPTHHDLLTFNAADPGHFISYLYRLNPMRRHKVLRPGELFYFVQEEAA